MAACEGRGLREGKGVLLGVGSAVVFCLGSDRVVMDMRTCSPSCTLHMQVLHENPKCIKIQNIRKKKETDREC